MAGKRKKPAYSRKRHNRLGVVLVSMVVLMILAVVGVKSIELRMERDAIEEKQAYYEELIEDEKARSTELAEFEKYTHTKKYAEEVAKDKLGYVKDGEILFVAE